MTVIEATSLQCRVERVQRVRHEHPLATRAGLEALVQMIEADRVWKPLTRRCRDAVRLAYTRALNHATATGAAWVALPALPEDTHPATVRALHRRGLAAEGRLTPLAVWVCHWAPAARDRPIETVHATGGAL